MKILKKLLPVLLAAVLLTGAFAAFSACVLSVPPEEEGPDRDSQGPIPVPEARFPTRFVYQDRVYTINRELEREDVGLTDCLIGMWVNAEDYEEYKAQYPDMEFVIDANNLLLNEKYNNSFYFYEAEKYLVEQCMVLTRGDSFFLDVFTSDLFIEQ